MTVAIFDLDRTLLDCNSGRLWLVHELRARRLKWSDAAWGAWNLGLYSLGYADLEAACHEAVATLEGASESELARRVNAWYDAEVQHRLRPGAGREGHRGAGDQLVLATSSSIYVARAAASHLAFDHAIATEMEVVDDSFTGRVSSLAFAHHKADRVLEWAERSNVDLADATFYTDSITDVRLMEQVGHPIAVHPDRKLRRVAADRGWPIVSWEITPR